MKTQIFNSSFLCAFLTANASAAVLSVSSIVTAPADPMATPEDTDRSLVSLTNADGTYSLDASTYVSSTQSGSLSHADNGSATSASDAAYLSDNIITTGRLNIETLTLDLAQTVNAGDQVGFAMFEIFVPTSNNENRDAVTFIPLDSAGDAIGSYELDVSAGDYGGALLASDYGATGTNSNVNVAGLTFLLSDFETTDMGDPALTGVAGLMIDDSANPSWDATLLGTYAIPEPSTSVLAMVALLACGFHRRR